MRRSTIALAAVAGLVLAACTAQVQPESQPDININTGEVQTGISVTGTGEVTGTPDTVEVNLGVAVLEDTVEEAVATAAEKADALIKTLTDHGVARDDITTTNYSIFPEYDYRGERERLIGYRVNNTVRVKIRDITDTGSIIDDATSAAGDEVRVNGIRFSIEDDAELIEAAREAAWNDALTKATQLAELSGQTLGPAVTINESVSVPVFPYQRDFGFAAADGLETPIEPGTQAVTITLQVQFGLQG